MANDLPNFGDTKQAIKDLLEAGSWRDGKPYIDIDFIQQPEEATQDRLVNIEWEGFTPSPVQHIASGKDDRILISYGLDILQHTTGREIAVKLRDRMLEDALLILMADRQLNGTVANWTLGDAVNETIPSGANAFLSGIRVELVAERLVRLNP